MGLAHFGQESPGGTRVVRSLPNLQRLAAALQQPHPQKSPNGDPIMLVIPSWTTRVMG